METKECSFCKKVITKKKRSGGKSWREKKFCSVKCGALNRSTVQVVNCSTCGVTLKRAAWERQSNKSYCSLRCRYQSQINSFKGSQNIKWKGDSVGYSGIHTWIRRTLGVPDSCCFCKKKGLNPRQYHWANLDGKYRRNTEDWKFLCVSCHKIYDLKRLGRIK